MSNKWTVLYRHYSLQNRVGRSNVCCNRMRNANHCVLIESIKSLRQINKLIFREVEIAHSKSLHGFNQIHLWWFLTLLYVRSIRTTIHCGSSWLHIFHTLLIFKYFMLLYFTKMYTITANRRWWNIKDFLLWALNNFKRVIENARNYFVVCFHSMHTRVISDGSDVIFRTGWSICVCVNILIFG